jgi:hypothetical protein
LLSGLVVSEPALNADGDHVDRLNEQRGDNDPARYRQALRDIVNTERDLRPARRNQKKPMKPVPNRSATKVMIFPPKKSKESMIARLEIGLRKAIT